MLELMFCSLLTILPDYLYRRYVQGKRFGKEITLYSVWFELRWGITTCVILTVCLITVDLLQPPVHDQRHAVFPNRPDPAGDQRTRRRNLCRPAADRSPREHRSSGSTASRQEAALETARRKIIEVDAALIVAQADIQKAEGQLREAKGDAAAGRRTNWTPSESCTGAIPASFRFATSRGSRFAWTVPQGAVAAATAAKQAAEIRVSGVLPAEKASAEAAAGAGPGRSRQDRHSRRRERARRAVLPAGRRHRQSADAAGRHPDPGRRGISEACRPASTRSKRRS